MTKPKYEQCWRAHRARGTFGWPPIEQLKPKDAHFSVVTCGAFECVASANRECRKVTGHDGEFRPFRRLERAS